MHFRKQNLFPAPVEFLLPGGRVAWLCALVALCVCLAFCPAAGAAQTQAQPPIIPPNMPGMNPGPPNQDPSVRHMVEKMARDRNTLRQKKIQADTERLLQLARELNDDVSHSSKNTLSVDVVKDAEEIEKLAKTIKEKMRDGR